MVIMQAFKTKFVLGTNISLLGHYLLSSLHEAGWVEIVFSKSALVTFQKGLLGQDQSIPHRHPRPSFRPTLLPHPLLVPLFA